MGCRIARETSIPIAAHHQTSREDDEREVIHSFGQEQLDPNRLVIIPNGNPQ
jgi:hypothetical protein